MVILLIVTGAVFSLLFVVNSILRAARGREKVSFFETLLAFLALVFPLLALVNTNSSPQPLQLVNIAAIGMGLVVIVVSVITFIIERRNPGRPFAQHRSVLGVGLGLLMVAATFVAPAAANLQVPGRLPTEAAGATTGSSNLNVADVSIANAVVNSPTPTLAKPVTIVPTNTPDAALLQMSATPTRFPSPMPTATNTPFVIATTTQGTITDVNQATGEPAAAQSTGCMAVVRQNVNLRSDPGTNFDLLLTIPFSSTLNVSARNKASDWWFVTYQSKTGWVSGDFINLDSICASLPVKAS